MAHHQKTVLIAHRDLEQSKVWKSALETQNINVNQVEPHAEIANLLDTMKKLEIPLPSLVLIDIGIKSRPPGQFSESPQAETVCRWIWKNQVKTKVVVLSSELNEISEVERGWAKRRGAVDVLPKLYQETLITNLQRITDILVCDFLPGSLQLVASCLLPLASVKHGEAEPSAFASLAIAGQQSDGEEAKEVEQEHFKMQTHESNRDETAIRYRGAKICASKMSGNVEPALSISDRVISPQPSITTDDDDVIIYRGVKMKKSR